MFFRLLMMIGAIMSNSTAWSFDCYYTLAKDSCWTNYNVSVNVIDGTTSTNLVTVNAPAGTAWVRQKFSCQPTQKLMYIAQFTPVFWQADIGKTYSATRYWFMPEAINSGDSAWNIPVCFPADFALVPLPPDAKGDCKCDFSVIPDIAPKPL